LKLILSFCSVDSPFSDSHRSTVFPKNSRVRNLRLAKVGGLALPGSFLRRDVRPKGNQVKMRRERDTQAETNSAVSGHLRQLQGPASTRSLRHGLEFERYAAAACSLMLVVVLAVGAAGYASIRGIFRTAAAAASTPPTADGNREADPDKLVTNGAVALGLIALLSLVVATNPSRIRVTSTSPESAGHPQISGSTVRKFCRVTEAWPEFHYASFEPRPPMRHLTDPSTRAASSPRHPIDRT
jgi:hypothetical protein